MSQDRCTFRTGSCLFLVLAGLLLLAPAGSAYNLVVDISVKPATVFTGGTATVYAHVYDADHYYDFPGATVSLTVTPPSGTSSVVSANTNSSGWAAFSETASASGTYTFKASSSVNYNDYPADVPSVGVQSATSDPATLTANTIPPYLYRTVSPGLITLATTISSVTATATATTTSVTTTAATEAATAAPTAASATSPASLPASSSDTVAPATDLTLTGTPDGSGGYLSDVTATLSASDNAGGSGVGVTQYSFDGSTWYTYSQPISVVKAGTTVLYYRSSDNAGNTEVAKVKAIVIGGNAGAAAAATTAQGTAAAAAGAAPQAAAAATKTPLPEVLAVLALAVCTVLGAARKRR